MNSEFEPLSDALYWELVERARQMTPEERMLEGFRLFDVEAEAVRSEIAKTMPGASEAELAAAVRHHFRLVREQERGPDFYEKLRYLPVP